MLEKKNFVVLFAYTLKRFSMDLYTNFLNEKKDEWKANWGIKLSNTSITKKRLLGLC